MADNVLLKERINKQAVNDIARALQQVYPAFRDKLFIRDCMDNLETLELKQRITHIIAVLAVYLPEEFPVAAKLLMALKQKWQPGKTGALQGFSAWPLIDYIAVYGLAHPDLALNVLEQLTPMFSAEFAIRPFIKTHRALTLSYMDKWCESPDEHVRRLVSEGSRPRLPWGERLPEFCDNPRDILPLLEKLKDDNSAYVRKSVANNLNDIGKDNPQILVDVCKKWQKNAGKETSWIIRHATRSLVKQGHQDILDLLGYDKNPEVSIEKFSIDKKHILLGDEIRFNFLLKSQSDKKQKIVIDYAVHHIKANGKTSAKVFKLKTADLLPTQTLIIEKKHGFKKITTREYYTGKHSLEILINGNAAKKTDFHLTV